jgi:hypothetical protein
VAAAITIRLGGFTNMKTIASLIALAFLVNCGSATPQRGFTEFPIIPPIADADPSHRQLVCFRVPSVLNAVRDRDSLAVNYVSGQTTNIMVGRKMVVGFLREEHLYVDGTAYSVGHGFDSGNNFVSGDSVFYLSQNGNPKPGQKITLESRISIFETDLPPQHMWDPENRKLFRILWTRTFKMTI